ncbi:hypothetical protein MB02_14095 [Croceicoccus estronivorus]|nr:hypothetical protein MB02_14095 [Croceicoccus estronivorus]
MVMRSKGDDSRDQLSGLMLKVADGDREAFARLFQQLAPRIKAYLIRLGSDPAVADDLTQDVMVTIWHKAGGFNPTRSSVMTWTFVIARNRRIDSLRRERSTVTYGHFPAEEADESATADDLMAGEQADALMRDAIASLPTDQQEVIRRSFFDEEPHSAIAAALGLPLGTVKSRLRIAFAKLRSRMEKLQ